jgi:hypothetical protein
MMSNAASTWIRARNLSRFAGVSAAGIHRRRGKDARQKSLDYANSGMGIGGASRARTDDLLVANEALSQAEL